MMQLDQQSRWQSWMRMLALDIRPMHESATSAGSARLRVSDWCEAAIAQRTLIATERYPLEPRKVYEGTD
jgi:hypothetical protein